jgi:ABC-type phosphate/phosphonate transport system substrate-binding protein
MKHSDTTTLWKHFRADGFLKCPRSSLWLLSCFLVFVVAATPATAQKGNSSTKIFNMGYALELFEGKDVRDATAAVDVWALQLAKGENSRMCVKSVVYENMGEMINAVKLKKVDMAVMSTLDYLKYRETCKLQPVVVAVKKGGYGDECVLIAHSAGGIASVRDLQKKTLGIVNNSRGAIFKRWFNNEWNRETSGKSKQNGPQWKESKKDEQVVFSVFFHQTDAGLVSLASLKTLMEMNPQLKSDITIVRTSPQFLSSLMCWSSDMSEYDKQDLMNIVKKMDRNPAGAQILRFFQTDKIVDFKPEYLEPVLALDRDTKLASKMK